MKRNNAILMICIVVMNLFITACETMDVTPTSDLTGPEVLSNVTGLQMLLNGTYYEVKTGYGAYRHDAYREESPFGLKILMSTAIASPDFLVVYTNIAGPPQFAIYLFPDHFSSGGWFPKNLWGAFYKYIGSVNLILANIDAARGDQSVKDAIKGQALAIRARSYFTLIRHYQHSYIIAKDKLGLPLRLEPGMNPLKRSTVQEVYNQIVKDLKEAELLLVNYNRPSRAYYDIDVVHFLLANVYLTINDWSNAQIYANKIRLKYPLMTLADYKNGFTKINEEWVLGYTQTLDDYTTVVPSSWFDFGTTSDPICNSPTPNAWIQPTNSFVEVIMKDDPRAMFLPNPRYIGVEGMGKWCTTKYREIPNVEIPYGDIIDFRAAEMYLVEAEAAARQGDINTALTVLNMVQNARPGAVVTTTTNQADLINAILLERRKEMYAEGLDYYDIMRLQNKVDKLVSDGFMNDLLVPVNSNKLILMLPEAEITTNPLCEQNPNPDLVPVFIP